jgi:hypothetical protein
MSSIKMDRAFIFGHLEAERKDIDRRGGTLAAIRFSIASRRLKLKAYPNSKLGYYDHYFACHTDHLFTKILEENESLLDFENQGDETIHHEHQEIENTASNRRYNILQQMGMKKLRKIRSCIKHKFEWLGKSRYSPDGDDGSSSKESSDDS